MRITNTVRPFGPPHGFGQHPYGQAADLQIPNYWSKHYEMALWIQNNVAFDQLLIEKNSEGTWVHVSYVGPGRKTSENGNFAPGNPYKVAGLDVSVKPAKFYLNGLPKW
jgi:hypothetical protein